jgi:hypothetical protein
MKGTDRILGTMDPYFNQTMRKVQILLLVYKSIHYKSYDVLQYCLFYFNLFINDLRFFDQYEKGQL